MCGSNAAGEPVPLHMMFSSEAKEASSYSVTVWCFFIYIVFLLNLDMTATGAFHHQLLSTQLEELKPGCYLRCYHCLLRICFLMQETKKGIIC